MICIYLKFYVILKIISASVLCANNFLFPFFSSFALEVCLFLLVFSKNYLFINFTFGRTGSSRVATQGLSLVVMGRGYSSLWCKGLIAVASLVAGHGLQAPGLSCPTACRIFLDQGSKLCPCISRRTLNTGPPGKSQNYLFDLADPLCFIFIFSFIALIVVVSFFLSRDYFIFINFFFFIWTL